MNSPSELPVASILIYPSYDDSTAGQQAKYFVVHGIKQDKPAVPGGSQGAIAFTVARVKATLKHSLLGDFFGAGGVLVPVPRHSRLRKGDLWPAERICEELLAVRIGEDLVPCLARTQSVAKSAFARPGERPGPADHYGSMSCNPELIRPTRLILVDDVVTRGATLIASARHLTEHFPRAEVVSFTIARVDRDARFGAVKEMFLPKLETITYSNYYGWLRRS